MTELGYRETHANLLANTIKRPDMAGLLGNRVRVVGVAQRTIKPTGDMGARVIQWVSLPLKDYNKSRVSKNRLNNRGEHNQSAAISIIDIRKIKLVPTVGYIVGFRVVYNGVSYPPSHTLSYDGFTGGRLVLPGVTHNTPTARTYYDKQAHRTWTSVTWPRHPIGGLPGIMKNRKAVNIMLVAAQPHTYPWQIMKAILLPK